ncbi:hypothetical protein ACS0TY_008099 [Phlomoides rotata]
MNNAGNATPTKESRWFSAVLAGILMCKVVYTLTGVISASLVKEYNRLNRKQKLEWNNRGFSTFHAIVAAAASLYLLTVSDLFDDSQDQLIINRTSSLSETVMGVMHHGLSMYAIIQSLWSGQAQIYILMVLFTESTTPFVNLRWYLDVAGRKNSKLYTYNGVALFFGWLVARIFLFVFFYYHMFVHFDQVKQVFPVGFYSLLTVPCALAVMNVFWFWKITRGMVKTLSKARRSH